VFLVIFVILVLAISVSNLNDLLSYLSDLVLAILVILWYLQVSRNIVDVFIHTKLTIDCLSTEYHDCCLV